MRSMLAIALCISTGCVYIIPDYAHRSKGMHKTVTVTYHTWLSSGRVNKQTGECSFTVFALATREHVMKLRVNGHEFLPDWSWAWEMIVPEGHHGSGTFVEFIEGDKIVARHEISATCPYRNEVIYD